MPRPELNQISTADEKNEYLDSAANIPVRVDGRLEKELKDKAGKALALQRKGAKLIFPDVLNYRTGIIIIDEISIIIIPVRTSGKINFAPFSLQR